MSTDQVVYTAVYGGYDKMRTQPVNRSWIDEEINPLPWIADPRYKAKWWKVRPDRLFAEGSVTIWVDGSMDILRADVPELLARQLGSDDLMLFRHPWRDCIYDEEFASRAGAKYDGMPMFAQVQHYRELGHPEHWGLPHCGVIVRRNTPDLIAVMRDWWDEITEWSVQDQLSLPFVLRRSNVKWHWAPDDIFAHFRFRGHVGPDIWRVAQERNL